MGNSLHQTLSTDTSAWSRRYLQDVSDHLPSGPILNHDPPPPRKLKCKKNASSPLKFPDIICCPPPPPLTSAPPLPTHHSEVWQQVGDFWQVALIRWLGKEPAWQKRTCVRFRTSLNLSDPLICDAPTEKPSFRPERTLASWDISFFFFFFDRFY